MLNKTEDELPAAVSQALEKKNQEEMEDLLLKLYK
jgi:hypothetical protein